MEEIFQHPVRANRVVKGRVDFGSAIFYKVEDTLALSGFCGMESEKEEIKLLYGIYAIIEKWRFI